MLRPEPDKPERSRLRRWLIVLGTALLSSLLALFFGFRFEVLIEDYALVYLSPSISPPADIALVAIGEDTLARLPYRSPIDRAFLAKIIQRIDKAGPRAIGLDILIDQPSESGKDEAFLKTLRQTRAPVVLGFATVEDGLTHKQAVFQEKALKGLHKGLVTLTRDDFDGIVRNIYPGRQVKGAFVPGFAAALAGFAGHKPPYPQGRINFYHDAAGALLPFKTYPAHTVEFLPDDWFRDKIILIGSALPTSDRHPTPFVTTHGAELGTPDGMAIHAHVLSQLMRGDSISAPGPLASAAIVLALAVMAALIVSLRLAPLAGLAAGLLIVYLSIAYLLFTTKLILIPVAAPILAAMITFIALSMAQWYKDRAARIFIEKAFSQYVSPAVVRRITTGQHQLSLGGEERMVTYLFTDIEGFTSLSESMEPAQTAALLNTYLDGVCHLFVEAEATIDKIVGDAVIGFFGAPEKQDNQARQAVELALAIDRFSEKHRKALAQNNIRFGITRIGVHKGKAIIGNFGGSRFFDYTGIGDTVNTAARLEAANRHLGTRICVSGAVVQDCPDLSFRSIGDIVLKGKQVPISCFEPLHPNQIPQKITDRYSHAFEQMARHDKLAVSSFGQLAGEFPQDPLIRLHKERLRIGETGTIIILKDK